ncbi:MAG: SCO family protein [Leptospiraceae bacterium]|nr:SCO family protein [Leptospiraceae bacterium]
MLRKNNFIIIVFILISIVFCKENEEPGFEKDFTKSYRPIKDKLPYYKSRNLDPYWSEKGDKPDDLRKLPSFKLISQTGDEVNNKKFLGKYSIVVFFYAKCGGICPMITRNMINFLPKIEDKSDFDVISITINPDNEDSKEMLKFRNNYKIKDENWYFLTGDKDTIYDLARDQFGAEINLVRGKNDLNDFVHTENVFLLDKENYLRGIYRAKGGGDLDRLLKDIEVIRKTN